MDYFLKVNKNGLILADIHIKKDERFSPEENYRLEKQPKLLLKRIKEIMKEESIGWIAILGDLLDICNCLPQELSVLNMFFEELNSFNIPIFVILGQHDIDSNKYNDSNIDIESRSHVTTLIKHFDNIYYANDKYILIDEKYSCYLSNYSDPVIYPKNYVDLWLTHCSLGFVDIEEFDENKNRKFGIMVAGDIHDHFVYGNCFTVGTPYQHKARENQIGVVGIIKVTSKKIEFFRKFTDSDKIKFLKFDPPQKNLLLRDDNGNVIDLELKQTNVLNEIESAIKELGIDYIHNKISKEGSPNPINFNFKINRLIIENYKSCKYLDLDFSTFNKVLYLLGEYRVGKSTIVEAIQDVFYGTTKTISSKVNHKSKECRIQIFFSYENKNYSIVRGIQNKDKGLFEFYINGEEQVATNKKGVENLMKTFLPFIDYLYLFIPPSNERLFTPEKSLELFQRCFNLDIFDYYLDQAVKLKKLFNEENNNIFNTVKIKEGESNILQQEVDRLKNSLIECKAEVKGDYESLLKEKEFLNKSYSKINFLTSSISDKKNMLENLNIDKNIKKENLDKLKESYEKEIRSLDELKEFLIKKENVEKNYLELKQSYLDLKKLKKDLPEKPSFTKEDLNKKLNIIKELNNEILNKKVDIQVKIKNIENDLNDLKNSLIKKSSVCPTCKQPIKINENEIKEKISINENLINSLNLELSKLVLEDENIIKKQLEYYEILDFNQKIEDNLKTITEKGNELKKELEHFNTDKKFDQDLYNDLKYKLNDVNLYLNNLEKASSLSKSLIDFTFEYDNLWKLLKKTYNISSEKEIANKIIEIDSSLSYHNIYLNYKKELENKENELNDCLKIISDLSKEYNQGIKQLEDWDTYIALMDFNNLNSIPYKLINMLVTNFNNDKFKIVTSKLQKNGSEKFSIDLMIKDSNYDYWVSYNSGASGAQKLLLDLFLYDSISKFMGGIGILTLDENLNTASTGLYSELNDLIPSMNFNNIIIISHSQQISCYDKKILVYLNDKHESVYSGINENIKIDTNKKTKKLKKGNKNEK